MQRTGWNKLEEMGGVLPLVGIAALAVFGFVVWVTAFTSDPPVKSDGPRDPGYSP